MWPLFNRVHDLRLHDPRRHTRTAISQFSRTLNFFSPHPFPCEFFVWPMFRPFPQMAHPPSHRVQQCGRQSCQPRACQRPRPAAPIIIWDFDTAPVGSGGRAWAAVNSLIHLCRSHGYTERPIIFFCYTRQRFAFPGKEQTVTAIRRHIPSHSAVVRTQTSAQHRDEVRARMHRWIGEHQQKGDGSLMVLLSGDPYVIMWQRMAIARTENKYPVIHICPVGISDEAWAVIASESGPQYWWHFNFGVDSGTQLYA